MTSLGLFGVYCVAPPGENIGDLAQAVFDSIRALAMTLTEEDIDRVREIVRSWLVFPHLAGENFYFSCIGWEYGHCGGYWSPNAYTWPSYERRRDFPSA